MLRFLIGKAGAGKTAAVIGRNQGEYGAGIGDSILLAPRQPTEAERELLPRPAGTGFPLYAEVLSFLARPPHGRREAR